MTGKRLLLLLLAGLLLVGAAIWLSASKPEPSVATGAPVLPQLQANLNAVTEVRLTKGDGSSVTLTRRASDWQVAERGFRADSGRLRKLLLDLAALEIRAEKTNDPANYARLGVEPAEGATATSVKIVVVTPEREWPLLVGKQDSPRAGFVRVPEQQTSYLAEPLITVDLDPKRWLDRKLLDIPGKTVRSITVVPAEGPVYTVSRDTAAQSDLSLVDMPRGASLAAPSAANAAADALTDLTFDDVRRRDANANAVNTRATYTYFDGATLTVAGQRDAAHAYISIVAASDATLSAATDGWEFEIPGWKFAQFFKPRGDLLAK